MEPLEVTMAIGVWVIEGASPAGAIVALRPEHQQALGLVLPNELYASGFPALPESPGLWIMTCPVDLPVSIPEEIPPNEAFGIIEFTQAHWRPRDAVWRLANERDLFIMRGEVPPGEDVG